MSTTTNKKIDTNKTQPKVESKTSPRDLSRTKVVQTDERSKIKTYAIVVGNMQKKPRTHSIYRICQIVCTKFEVSPKFQTKVSGELRLDIFFKRHPQKSIKSKMILEDPKLPLKIQTNYTIQYVHHLKENRQLLDVIVKYKTKGRYHLLGVCTFDMKKILQCPVDSAVPLINKNQEETAKIWLKVTTVPATFGDLSQFTDQMEQEELYDSEDEDEEIVGYGSDTSSDDEVEIFGYQEENIKEEGKKNNFIPNLLKKGIDKVFKTKEKEKGENDQENVTGNNVPMATTPHKPLGVTTPRAPQNTPIMQPQFDKEEIYNSPDILVIHDKKEELKDNDVFKPEEYISEKVTNYIFINTKTRRGKKLFEIMKNDSELLTKVIVPTRSFDDVSIAVKYLANSQFDQLEIKKKIKILLMGTDTYVNDFLRACTSLALDNPKIMDLFQFFLIPTGKEGNNLISEYLGELNETYSDYFCDLNWRQLFEKTKEDKISSEQIRMVLQSVSYYLENGTDNIKLDIAEALLTILSKDKTQESQMSVPFLSNVHIGEYNNPQQQDQIDPVELKLDYWLLNSKSKDSKKSVKSSKYQTINAFNLPTKLISSEEFYPSPGALSLQIQPQMKSQKKSTPCENELVTKFIGKVEKKKTGFKTTIDGVEFYGVKFVSLSPKWFSSLQFSFAVFPRSLSELSKSSIELDRKDYI
eukprot:gene133-4379_t